MNNFKKFFNKKVINISIFVIVLAFVAIYSTSVKSSSTDNLSGYMWSADNWSDVNGNGVQDSGEIMTPPGGAGWISVNCLSGGNCAGNDYGVTLETDGDLVGYAWSPHFGWLQFGGLSGFPIGSGTVSENAKVLPNGDLTGWARFCAGAANNSTCSGNPAQNDTSTGGWDGWVSLKGTGYGVHLTIDPETSAGEFDGYAWGGNQDSSGMNTTGTGWIAWSTDISGVIYIPDVSPYVLLTATPNIVQQNGTTTLSWEGYGLVAGNVCTATEVTFPGDGGWVSPPLYSSANGSTFVTQPLNQLGTHTFKISCPKDGPGGGVAESTVDVSVGINLNFIAEPSPAPYSSGYTTTLYWSVVPSDTVFESCTAVSATDAAPPLGNNVPGTGWPGSSIAIPPSSKANIFVPVNPTFFTISCVTPQNVTVTKTVSVARGNIPEAGIVFTNTDVVPNGSGGFTTNLTWSTTNVESGSCDAETDNPDTGTGWNWDNGAEFGTQSGVIVPALAPAFTTYRLKCTRIGGGEIEATPLTLNNLSKASRIVKPHYKEN
ncbi:MAG: hypothetical protein QG583_438 [Patescibacteria group bacterium]|nr:hypothetical protein [Patescibacteria group bacterium]